MSNQSFLINGGKEAEVNGGDGFSPGRCLTEQHGGSGRHPTTSKGSRRRK